jgi:hypothetical protein
MNLRLDPKPARYSLKIIAACRGGVAARFVTTAGAKFGTCLAPTIWHQLLNKVPTVWHLGYHQIHQHGTSWHQVSDVRVNNGGLTTHFLIEVPRNSRLAPTWCQSWCQVIHQVPLTVPTWCHTIASARWIVQCTFAGRSQLSSSRCGKICPLRAWRYRALPHKKPLRFYRGTERPF